MKNIRSAVFASLLAAPLAMPGAASAQGQPVSIIVPYSAGGSGDTIARILSEGLKKHLDGRPVIVENRPGASGRIAMQALKNAHMENSAVVLAFSGVLINSIIYPSAKDYDFKNDFVGLAQVGKVPAALAVPIGHKARNIADFVSQHAAKDGVFTYGNIGQGSFTHLAGLRFADATKLEPNPIGYQGGTPMANDLMGGQIESGIDTLGDFVERHNGKRLKVLGVFGRERSPLLPGVPTMVEQGIANVEAEIWLGFLASSKMKAEFSQPFQEAVKRTLEDANVRNKVAQLLEVDYQPSTEFARIMASDFATWTPVVRAAGLVQR
ncbi:Tripartite tricarboxylate transporter family receptor [compost metagenome]